MTLPNDGIYPGVPFRDYLAWGAWGSSSLKAMRVGPPARVLWERENPRKDTDATIRGTRAHCLILTPDLFAAEYVELPDDAPDRPTAAMLAAAKPSPASVERQRWWRDFDAVAAGREPIKSADMAEIRAIRDAFQAKRAAADSIEGARVETSLVWTDPTTGARCKGRPDWYDDRFVYDLKITRDAGPRLAFKAFVNGWMHQLAHNRTGLRTLGVEGIETGRLVAVNPEAPHYVWCIEIKSASLDILGMENERTLAAMESCAESGVWPDTDEAWVKVEIPTGALQEVVGAIDFAGAMEV